MARSPLRVGLLGYGFGGRYFHAPLIASAPECELIGVVTRSDERRGELARDHPGTPAYSSLAELAAHGAQAVAISTPAATHTALTREAIAMSLPVVCDKPFALDAASARETVQLAEREQVPLTVYQNRRWDSDLRTLRRVMEEGWLGAVRRFVSRFERFAPQPGPPAAGGPGCGANRSKRDTNRRTAPSHPSSITRRRVRRSESHRRFWYTVSGTCSRSASCTVSRADAASSANGLSQTTGRLMAMASRVSAVCVAAGVDMATACAPCAASSASEL